MEITVLPASVTTRKKAANSFWTNKNY